MNKLIILFIATLISLASTVIINNSFPYLQKKTQIFIKNSSKTSIMTAGSISNFIIPWTVETNLHYVVTYQ